jgi:hypothetical protein
MFFINSLYIIGELALNMLSICKNFKFPSGGKEMKRLFSLFVAVAFALSMVGVAFAADNAAKSAAPAAETKAAPAADNAAKPAAEKKAAPATPATPAAKPAEKK